MMIDTYDALTLTHVHAHTHHTHTLSSHAHFSKEHDNYMPQLQHSYSTATARLQHSYSTGATSHFRKPPSDCPLQVAIATCLHTWTIAWTSKTGSLPSQQPQYTIHDHSA
mmetsp:Transcript_12690/g.27491  ORF Transcript_12690/g.27491 Transcript_12690/m.27491 type:complete len:110 (+) Transcript_12690:192-521(+)